MSEKEYVEIQQGLYFDCDEEFLAFDLPEPKPLPKEDIKEEPKDVRDSHKSDQPDAD